MRNRWTAFAPCGQRTGAACLTLGLWLPACGSGPDASAVDALGEPRQGDPAGESTSGDHATEERRPDASYDAAGDPSDADATSRSHVETCDSYHDCELGRCIPFRFRLRCAQTTGQGTCMAGRISADVCTPSSRTRGCGAGNTVFVCADRAALLGLPCGIDDDCWLPAPDDGTMYGNWACAWSTGDVAFAQCTASCMSLSEHPDYAAVCASSETKSDLLTGPTPHACPIGAALKSAAGTCRRSNAHGTCQGIATCPGFGPGVFPACDAPDPTTETCATNGKGDGIDQDCDGQTDEGCGP